MKIGATNAKRICGTDFLKNESGVAGRALTEFSAREVFKPMTLVYIIKSPK